MKAIFILRPSTSYLNKRQSGRIDSRGGTSPLPHISKSGSQLREKGKGAWLEAHALAFPEAAKLVPTDELTVEGIS